MRTWRSKRAWLRAWLRSRRRLLVALAAFFLAAGLLAGAAARGAPRKCDWGASSITYANGKTSTPAVTGCR